MPTGATAFINEGKEVPAGAGKKCTLDSAPCQQAIKWFYDNTKRGDIVEVVNTVGSVLPGTDGLGDWNIPWEQWKAGNAGV